MGLVLPCVERSGGQRLYSFSDVEWLRRLKAFLEEEESTPGTLSLLLSLTPARAQRLQVGEKDCGVVKPPGRACWTVNAHDPEWRLACRKCPGMLLRENVFDLYRQGEQPPPKVGALLAEFDLSERLALTAFEVRGQLSALSLQVDILQRSLESNTPRQASQRRVDLIKEQIGRIDAQLDALLDHSLVTKQAVSLRYETLSQALRRSGNEPPRRMPARRPRAPLARKNKSRPKPT
jgi:DNA-binding transcriptional MerR regulator